MADLLYIGIEGGVEATAVPSVGIPLLSLRLRGPDSVVGRFRFAFDLLVGVATCVRRLRQFRPNAVFSTGGFVSLPAVIAARLLRVPVMIYLPDVRPGWAVRLTSRSARQIAVTSDATVQRLPHTHMVRVTGYPVRSEFVAHTREDARATLGLKRDDLLLFITGGSQGSVAVNQAVVEILADVTPLARVLHVCGPRNFTALSQERDAQPVAVRDRYELVASLDGDRMAQAMHAADLAITRAGASILGELPMTGLPAIVIPLPINAQDVNAEALESRGACVVLKQQDAVAGQLKAVVVSLLTDSDRCAAMRQVLESLRMPNAARDIAATLIDISGAAV
jgi:UDP-N-acetylglucosamine--N-acetylmuramyl-(pentapeptide) pyrophosphoryl-undecaprenol N-acetylglucosamine transferase